MIRFCGQVFSKPIPLHKLDSFSVPGVYCFMVRDPAWTPLCYRPVYFGITDDFSDRVSMSHEAVGDWESRGGSSQDLYVSLLRVVNESDRTRFERRLIEEYQPDLNTQHQGKNRLAAILRRGLFASESAPGNLLREYMSRGGSELR